MHYVMNPKRKARKAKARKAAKSPAPSVVVVERPKTAVKRKSKKRGSRTAKYARKAGRKARRAYRAAGMTGIVAQLIPAGIGAAGALAAKVALGYLPIPPALKTPTMTPVLTGGLAIAAGMLLRKVLPAKTVDTAVAGALTVVLYDVARNMLLSANPAMPGLSEYGDSLVSLGYVGAGDNVGVGEYVNTIGNMPVSVPSYEAVGEYVN